MSGHSRWAKVHRQKSVTDSKRGAIFTKMGNLITVAARSGGGDPEANFQLRLVMDKAREVNMPKENIERAISRGTGKTDGQAPEEAIYEVFGSAGSVFIVEAVTDNKNRTVAEIKNILNKNGGRFGEQNSVNWMFERRGLVIISAGEAKKINADELELKLIDFGAEDIKKEAEEWEIYTKPENLPGVGLGLKEMNIVAKESGFTYLPKNEIKIDNPEDQEKIEKLFAALSDFEDVSNVYTNANW